MNERGETDGMNNPPPPNSDSGRIRHVDFSHGSCVCVCAVVQSETTLFADQGIVTVIHLMVLLSALQSYVILSHNNSMR